VALPVDESPAGIALRVMETRKANGKAALLGGEKVSEASGFFLNCVSRVFSLLLLVFKKA
jgi:hypothetical protein